MQFPHSQGSILCNSQGLHFSNKFATQLQIPPPVKNGFHSTIPTIPTLTPNASHSSQPFMRGGSKALQSPRLTPWKLQDYHMSIIGLHHEINDFCNYMQPTPSEKRARTELISRVRHIALREWPDCSVEVFGSFSTQTYLPSSDIDLVIFGEWPSFPLKSLERELVRDRLAREEEIKVLDRNHVPLIRFTDITTKIRVDVSFNMTTGPESASLIRKFIKNYSALPKLLLILKQFLVQRDLHEVFSGGMSSYALAILIVNFLQLHPRRMATDDDANLGVLLIEFCELYGRLFNYKNTGIRVTDGGSYFLKKHHHSYHEEQSLLLFIEDPLDAKNIISRGAFSFPVIRHAFEHAFLLLCSTVLGNGIPNDYQSVLSMIIFVEPEFIEHRKWIEKNWPVTENSSQNSDYHKM